MRTQMLSKSKMHYLIFSLILLFVVAVYIFLTFFSKTDSVRWKFYSTHEIDTDLQNNKVILISVMASWSNGTLFHEYAFIRQPSVENLILSKNIACYRVDLAEIPGHQIADWRETFNDGVGLGMILLKKDFNNEIITRIIPYNEMSVKKVISEIETISSNSANASPVPVPDR